MTVNSHLYRHESSPRLTRISSDPKISPRQRGDLESLLTLILMLDLPLAKLVLSLPGCGDLRFFVLVKISIFGGEVSVKF